MVHDFFQYYGCRGKGSCDFNLFERIGKTGHRSAWQDAAFALEMAAVSSSLQNIKVDLGRDWALARELGAMEKTSEVDIDR